MLSSVPDGFTYKDVVAIVAALPLPTRLTRGLLQDWLQKGLIAPSIVRAGGRGIHRHYSLDDIIRIVLAARLTTYGIPTRSLLALLPRIDTLRATGVEVAIVGFLGLDADGVARWFVRAGTRAEMAHELVTHPKHIPWDGLFLQLQPLSRLVALAAGQHSKRR